MDVWRDPNYEPMLLRNTAWFPLALTEAPALWHLRWPNDVRFRGYEPSAFAQRLLRFDDHERYLIDVGTCVVYATRFVAEAHISGRLLDRLEAQLRAPAVLCPFCQSAEVYEFETRRFTDFLDPYERTEWRCRDCTAGFFFEREIGHQTIPESRSAPAT